MAAGNVLRKCDVLAAVAAAAGVVAVAADPW